MDRPARFAPS